MSWLGNALGALGAGAVGAVGGFMIGGPIGAMAGFGIGVGAAAAGMAGSTSAGTWGGAIAGGLVGFSVGGPVGALVGAGAGALFGGTIAGAFNQQPQCPSYGQYFPGGYGQQYGGYGQCFPGYGQPLPGAGNYGYGGYGAGFMGMPFGIQGFQNPGAYGLQNYGGCFPPQQQQCPCYPPQQQQPCQQGGQLTQNGSGQPIQYTTHGGYKVDVNGGTVTITDPSGKHTVQHSGDPHEYVDGQHVKDWDDKTRTMVLGDGTRITMDATASNGTIQNTAIYDGAEEVKINNNGNNVQSVSFNPYQSAYDQSHQAAGETAYFGQDQSGALVYKDLFKQNSDLSVTPYNRDISVLEQPHRHHHHWNQYQVA